MDPSAYTILVVEDEEPVRHLLKSLLLDEGYTVIEAQTADQALVLLGQHTVQLILLDLHMPGQVDGEELLFLLRDQGDEVPIVVVSGWVDDDATIYQPDCVHAVIKKPFQPDHLIRTVRVALSA